MNPVEGRAHGKASTAHWWHQRLTAIALLPLGLWFAFTLPGIDLGSHAAVAGWMREPLTAILLALMAICLVYHSWLGVRVVLEDYVHGEAASRFSLLLCTVLHALVLVACLAAILRIAFGSQ